MNENKKQKLNMAPSVYKHLQWWDAMIFFDQSQGGNVYT